MRLHPHLATVVILGLSATAAALAEQGAADAEQNPPLQLCLGAAADYSPVYPTDRFPPGTTEVTAVFAVDAEAEFPALTAVFIAVDVGDAAPANYEIARVEQAVEPGQRGRFRYSQPGPMPPGEYRLDVLAGGDVWQSLPFHIDATGPDGMQVERPQDLLPLNEGMVWTYAYEMEAGPGARITLPGVEPDEAGRLRATVKLTVREADDAGRRVELLRNDQLVYEEWFRLDRGGLIAIQRRVEGELVVLDPPQVLWGLPLAPATWEYAARDGSFQQVYRTFGPVPITVLDEQKPGQVVLVEQPTPVGRITIERHFVPGIGMVREVMTTGIAGKLASRQTLTLTAGPEPSR